MSINFRGDSGAALTLLRLIALATLGLLWSFELRGQTQSSAAEREVLATDDRRTEALRRGDAAPLRQIYADDYTLVTPAGVVRNKTDQVSEIESGRLRYPTIQVTERAVRVYGDVAVVLSRDKYSILLDGREVGGDLRVTRVYKRFGKQWRVIATHGSAVAP